MSAHFASLLLLFLFLSFHYIFPLPLYPNSRLCSSTFISPPILCLGTLAVTLVCDMLGSEEDTSLTNLDSPANWCSKENIGLHCSVVSTTHPLKLYKHKQTVYFFVCQQKKNAKCQYNPTQSSVNYDHPLFCKVFVSTV